MKKQIRQRIVGFMLLVTMVLSNTLFVFAEGTPVATDSTEVSVEQAETNSEESITQNEEESSSVEETELSSETEAESAEEANPLTTQTGLGATPRSIGVTVNTTSPTLINMSLVSGDVVIKADGLYVNGVSEGETGLNSNGYRLYSYCSRRCNDFFN